MSDAGHSSTMQQIVEEVARALSSVRHVVAVLSCKGGVGKSLVSASIAIAVAHMGKKVAILDADIHGPSIPWILGIENSYLGSTIEGKIIPVEVDGIAVVSLELLLEDRSQPIVWRGPLKTRTLIQLVTSTNWGPRDLMIIDLPPGTGDEALTIAHAFSKKLDGVILVATPGEMVRHVVTKAKRFAELLGIPLIGLVLNMAYLTCPHCGKTIELFGPRKPIEGVELLGEIPLDPALAKAVDESKLREYLSQDNESSKRIRDIAYRVVSIVEKGKDRS